MGVDAGAAESVLGPLLRRRSVGPRHLDGPGPDAAQLRLMAQAACRAPDHGHLRPFRFQVVRGDARERLAELFAAAARDAGKDAQGAAQDAQRAGRAPVTVAVTARIDATRSGVPVEEQWAAVGGAVANFLNAAHLLGFAGKMLSGAKVRQPRLIRAFCDPGDVLVGWIALGTPTRPADEAVGSDDDVAAVLSDWTRSAADCPTSSTLERLQAPSDTD